jgi:hypothetical protein
MAIIHLNHLKLAAGDVIPVGNFGLVLKSRGKSVAIYKFTKDALQPLTETEWEAISNLLQTSKLLVVERWNHVWSALS